MKNNSFINSILRCWLLTLLVVFSACSDDETVNFIGGDKFYINPEQVAFPTTGGEQVIKIYNQSGRQTNDKLDISVAESGQSWCSVEVEGSELTITAGPVYGNLTRETTVSVTIDGFTRSIAVKQERVTNPSLIDIQLGVVTGEASSIAPAYKNTPITKAYDGSYTSFYHSDPNARGQYPYILEFELENLKPSILDYIVYYPAPETQNTVEVEGGWGKLDIYVETLSQPYFKVGSYDLGEERVNPVRIDIDKVVVNPLNVRFVINSSSGGVVSLGEIEFYQKNPDKFEILSIFTDGSCSQIKEGITRSDLEAIPIVEFRDLALAIFNGKYDTEFRIKDFRPYQNSIIMANHNKTREWSYRDGFTGIYVDGDEGEIMVCVGPTKGQSARIIQQNLFTDGYGVLQSWTLREGVNILNINTGKPGLLYVINPTDDDIPLILKTEQDKAAAEAKTVRVNFIGGKVNGYFDTSMHTNEDWPRIRDNATYRDIDIVGTYTHITWPVEHYTESSSVMNNLDITALIADFDELVYEEMKFMGLVKYNRTYNTRMYMHRAYTSENPHAGAGRTGYLASQKSHFTINGDMTSSQNNLWTVGHEVGHMNQIRPNFCWTGMTEVTNNLIVAYLVSHFCYHFSAGFDQARESYIDGTYPYMRSANAMLFRMITPLWQLQMYFYYFGDYKDFYPDLFEELRNERLTGTTDGVYILDFIRKACELSRTNLLDFFEAYNILIPFSEVVSDYTNALVTITQEDIDALKAEIEAHNFPPPTRVIQDLTNNDLPTWEPMSVGE